MASEDKTQDELDEDGLVVQHYDSTVLVVLPPAGFGEQILRYARSSLYNVHVGTWSVSTVVDELIKGRLQDEFMVDGPLADASMDKYSGILIAGGAADLESAKDPAVLALLRAADADQKLIAGWGNAVETLAEAGVVKRRKVTGDARFKDLVARKGGRYTGREVEVSGHVVTSRDEGAGMRFGQALADLVRLA